MKRIADVEAGEADVDLVRDVGCVADQLEFVLRTSILDTLTGPLCDAVLERSGSLDWIDVQEEEPNRTTARVTRTLTGERAAHELKRAGGSGRMASATPTSRMIGPTTSPCHPRCGSRYAGPRRSRMAAVISLSARW